MSNDERVILHDGLLMPDIHAVSGREPFLPRGALHGDINGEVRSVVKKINDRP